MKESKIYKEYSSSGCKCTFEEYLFENYNLMEFYFEQSESWADDLGLLICEIYRSGLLKDTKFESKLRNIHIALDV